MKLSVIIVNYNVRRFLEQCLDSVLKAGDRVDGMEVIVVDNNSVDGSAEMLKQRFPQVTLIQNHDNKGFSAANNQGITVSGGEYVLLLNPDTIVEEDTFSRTVGFMDGRPDAGGLGVKMIDGKGAFLPESKRGLPTPWASFCKMAGLARLFPASRTFNGYHVGYLDKDKIHEVEILAGAFMLLRRSALDKTGLLDEAFFMYGEDIDLSYRLIKAGYKNIYYPETRIIHYKGESTRKGSLNYVFVFYNAMAIFARKHFSGNNARIVSSLIKAAIYFRAGLSVLHRLALRIFLPALEAGLIFSGMMVIRDVWERKVMLSDGPYYPVEFIAVAVPAYILIWLSCVFATGGYEKPVRTLGNVRGIALGTVLILVIYALIPESWRFSRALILLGAFWAILAAAFLRGALQLLGMRAVVGDRAVRKNIAVVGHADEALRVSGLLNRPGYGNEVTGWVSPGALPAETALPHLGPLSRLNEIVTVHKIDEIVFCIKDLTISQIITQMASLGARKLVYKIAPPEGMHMIGSSSLNTAGDLYMIDISAISNPENRRNKRLLDLVVTCLFLPALPLLLFVTDQPLILLRNMFLVLTGSRSWVGYVPVQVAGEPEYPGIKPGIVNPADALKNSDLTESDKHDLNLRYAKDFSVFNDLVIIWRGMRRLGRNLPDA